MSSRRQSNGRSPLVNPNRQITAFFTKASRSQSQSSSQLPIAKPRPNPVIIHSISNLNSKTAAKNPNPSCCPTTPSPLIAKSKSKINVTKTPPVIGQRPSASSLVATSENEKELYGFEVVNKKIRVYWPLNKCWYEGYVKSFNKLSGKHLIQYDDGEEEMIYISKEKIEWLEGSIKTFKRLRRVLVVNEDDEEEEETGTEGHDSEEEEDWCNNRKAIEKERVPPAKKQKDGGAS